MKKLSVIIPVYNVEAYVEKCIRSVKESGLEESQYEIIVVDDESPDKSVERIRNTFPNDPAITIISQKNKGLGGARNTGIKASQGNYLLFLDSDDVLTPGVLQELLLIAESQETQILEFGAKGVDMQGKEIYTVQNTSDGNVLSGIQYYNTIRYMNSACNKLYKRTFLLENELFFLERIFIEDFEFNTRAFYKAAKVYAVPQIGACFLQTENSITRNSNKEKKQKMVQDIKQVLDITHTLYQTGNGELSEVKNFFEERLNFLVATLFYHLMKNKEPFEIVKGMKEELQNKGMYYVDHPIYQKNKNLFRLLILKNIYFYKIFSSFL
ncbi:glycosyltransferase [Flavobacterium sp. NRK F10]|uniref:glycosyltransferase family 2 protein n=1 Tax=Flavobacterium sp. NRK F10 TaxID=2954931 RepID=UPI0020910207|nr:glycosyltransferase family 2 protein [Flavobacterium sp. NRK F10]MCO6174211.1 glycosyltransferase [Flavobacterium sp. NRK F10]